MTDHEMLEAMFNTLQQVVSTQQQMQADLRGVQATQQQMQANLRDVQSSQQQMQADLRDVQSSQQQMQADLRGVQATQQQMQTDLRNVQAEVRRVAITQENVVLPKIQLIYESQADLIDKNKTNERFQRKVENLQDDMFVVKEAIRELKKAQ